MLAAALGTGACFVDEPHFGASTTTTSTTTTTTTTTTDNNDTTTDALTDATASPGSSQGSTAGGVCGDGLVDEGEECDDGDLDAGDGCSPTCTNEPPPLVVFVSQGRINGNAGTIADVDAKCQSEAMTHGLPGVYFAWLSFDNTSAPALRFVAHERAYVLPGPDAPLVALGLSGLLGKFHKQGINRGPDGVELPPQDGCSLESLVWTGTRNDGTAHVDNCAGFTSADASAQGRAGRYTGSGTGWSDNCSFECSNSLPVYCFQQPEMP